ncbi:GIY-YIG nuclease family protein [Rheinheimera texasensis]|uniref:GIY-YIG nuclease family protein n=1 Tax=Rheinheimera texasensis TaxID=306205 RepID=UPI0004E17728|nr:GIY-YIG nuclease family protein [Rheinheimera texasensis]
MVDNKLELKIAIDSFKSATDNFIQSLSFSTPELFENQIENKGLEISGVYYIEIRSEKFLRERQADWKRQFISFWDKTEFHATFTPKSKKKRLDAHKSMREWTPLYIGKSENIKKRLNDHKTLRLDQRTRGLKLDARGVYEHDCFRVSHIEISMDIYNYISATVENHFRNTINPLVGI